MGELMTEFDRMILEVPPMWEYEDEWTKAYAEADTSERPLIKTQARLSSLLEDLDDASATPLNLGWLSLWVKTLHLCAGARGAYHQQSPYSLSILHRVTFESNLHLGAIIQPRLEATGQDGVDSTGDLGRDSSVARLRVRQRLEAYAAWCLFGDLEYWKGMNNERRLREIWDPTTASRLAEKMGEDRELWEDFLGEFEVQSPSEAQKELEEAKAAVSDQVEKFEMWLSHPDLQTWREKLERKDREKNGHVTFFELFEENEGSMWRRLRSIGMQFAYSDWKRTSQAIHGSSLDQSLEFAGSVALPSIGVDAEELSDQVSRLSDFLQWNAFALYLTQPSKLSGN